MGGGEKVIYGMCAWITIKSAGRSKSSRTKEKTNKEGGDEKDIRNLGGQGLDGRNCLQKKRKGLT